MDASYSTRSQQIHSCCTAKSTSRAIYLMGSLCRTVSMMKLAISCALSFIWFGRRIFSAIPSLLAALPYHNTIVCLFAMLCALCVSIFQDPRNEGYHHKNRQNLVLASENGCKICSFLTRNGPEYRPGMDSSWPLQYEFSLGRPWRIHLRLSIFQKSADATDDKYLFGGVFYIHVSHAQSFPPHYSEFINLATADLETVPFLVRPDVPMERDIPDHTGHEAVAQLAKGWLRECKRNHACGDFYQHRQVGWYPKRLVCVGQGDQRPRLVLRDENDLRGPYATLSHCWGENPEFFMLNADNLEDLRKEIPLGQLAASFRDAILTCQRLQIPYIWIDSLCILQAGPASQSDWLFHANEMHRVYLNCELNIAIDVSANPHEGAFRLRDPRILQDCYIWTPFHSYSDFPQQLLEWKLDLSLFDPKHHERSSLSKADQINLCTIFTKEDFYISRLGLPLSQRAWVFQEALLSPRTLRFGSDRIWWECAERTTLSECMPNSVANGTEKGFDCLFQSSFNIENRHAEDLYSYFDYLMTYTERKLSHPKEDKLVAFAAIARLCASWFGGDYCAGIFRNSMPWGLLWVSQQLTATPRPDSYRAPSWSWASLDNRILFTYYDQQPDILAHVLDVSVQLVDTTDPFGQVKSAALTLQGPLISSQALVGEGSTEQSTNYLVVSTLLDEKISLDPDDHDCSFRSSQPKQHPDYYPCLGKNLHFLCIGKVECTPAWKRASGTYGLMLRKVDDGSFVRVGRWVASVGFIQRHAGTECELRLETITLL